MRRSRQDLTLNPNLQSPQHKPKSQSRKNRALTFCARTRIAAAGNLNSKEEGLEIIMFLPLELLRVHQESTRALAVALLRSCSPLRCVVRCAAREEEKENRDIK